MNLSNGTQSRRSYLVKDQGVSDSETDGGDLLLVVLDLGLPIGFKGLDGLGGDLQWGITGGVFLFLLEAHYLSQFVGGWLWMPNNDFYMNLLLFHY